MTGFNALPAQPPQTPGFPSNPLPIVFDRFAGLNTQASRPGIKDEEMSWVDGWFPIGPSNLRTLWGAAPSVYTASGSLTVQWFGFANLGSTPYMYVLLSDGSVQQVQIVNNGSPGGTPPTGGTVTQVMTPGTVSAPSSIAMGFSQWGTQYILFSASQTNGYWTWDGTTLHQSGDGTITSGISGNCIGVYTGHVWVGNGASVNFSAPGSTVDFTTGDGGGSFTSSDPFLRRSYIQFIQTNGFFYLLADSSINYISGVVTSGSSPTTTFTNQNADPQVGTPWPWSVQLFSRNIVFANSFGVFVSYGGATQKVSSPLDGIYNSVPNHGPITPSAAVAEIFGIACYALLLPVIDQYTGQQVNKLCLWDGKKWFTSGQDVDLNFIATLEIDSDLWAFGTDGTSVYPLFSAPSPGFTKVAQSKLFSTPHYLYTKTEREVFGIVQNNLPNTAFALTVNVDSENPTEPVVIPNPSPGLTWTNASGQPIVWTNASAQTITWVGAGLGIFGPLACGQNGRLIGMTAVSTSEDLTLVSLTALGQAWGANV